MVSWDAVTRPDGFVGCPWHARIVSWDAVTRPDIHVRQRRLPEPSFFRQGVPRRCPCASQSLVSTLIFAKVRHGLDHVRQRRLQASSFFVNARQGVVHVRRSRLQGPSFSAKARQGLVSVRQRRLQASPFFVKGAFGAKAPRPRIVSWDAVTCPDPFVERRDTPRWFRGMPWHARIFSWDARGTPGSFRGMP